MNSLEIVEIINKLNIKNVSDNSKNISPGDCFFAIKGSSFNGEDFAIKAQEEGAVCIVSENPISELKIPNLVVKDIRQCLADFCKELYQDLPQNLVAVTGTNGKTSVAQFYAELCRLNGIDCASIGTLGVQLNGNTFADTINTTPGVIELYKTLSKLKQQGVDNVIIEASSIGLEQKRMHGLNFVAAGFTNFSHDHLDYHKTIDNYLKAKQILFQKLLSSNASIVVNSDDENSSNIIENTSTKSIYNYGKNAKDLKILEVENNGLSTTFSLSAFSKTYKCQTKLIGDFQIYNIVCTVGLLASVFGNDNIGKFINKIPQLNAADGRLSLVAQNNDVAFFIDYAHTPDALENILQTLRPYTKNRLIVVFGCGGDRDQNKRSKMGNIAGQYADVSIITDDNPRTEDASKIRQEILQNCDNAVEVANRDKAILRAKEISEAGDIIVVAGKGHEDYQIIGQEKKYFSDREEILKVAI